MWFWDRRCTNTFLVVSHSPLPPLWWHELGNFACSSILKLNCTTCKFKNGGSTDQKLQQNLDLLWRWALLSIHIQKKKRNCFWSINFKFAYWRLKLCTEYAKIMGRHYSQSSRAWDPLWQSTFFTGAWLDLGLLLVLIVSWPVCLRSWVGSLLSTGLELVEGTV